MQDGKENVAQFELIPWILGQCASMKEVHELLDRINIVNTPFSPQFPLALDAYSRGMGALGLPGDLSSASRFARVAFTNTNSLSGDSEEESVSQFFHILGSVDKQRGCCEVAEGKYEITIYTSCCNTSKGIYYYTTYENPQITAVNMHATDLNGTEVVSYPMLQDTEIRYQN